MVRPRTRLAAQYNARPAANVRRCDFIGCGAFGEFRAPRARDKLTEYFWFCLDHVRAYNAAWDYYKGMSAEEIEAARRSDTVGWRPTWPLGTPRGRHDQIDPDQLRAAFSRLFDEDMFAGHEDAPPRTPKAITPEEEALAVMDLQVGVTQDEIKARYKALVKLHHPDANGGDKAAEERLKSINQAYTFLKAQAQHD
jgi:DnaJ-domain-containing protein 1